MRLILARHGETASNRDGLGLGLQDVPLTEKGRHQAEALAEALAGVKIDAVYSSPLRRALDTAQAIASRHGLEVVVDEGLTEMDVGELDGLTLRGDARTATRSSCRAGWAKRRGRCACPAAARAFRRCRTARRESVRRMAERHGRRDGRRGDAQLHDPRAALRRAQHVDMRLPPAAARPGGDQHRSTCATGGRRCHVNDTCHLEACGLAEPQVWPVQRPRE